VSKASTLTFFALLILWSLSISASNALAAGGTFAPVGNLTQATIAPYAALLASGRVLVIVGTTGNLDLFDPTTQNFTAAGTANAPCVTVTALKTGKASVGLVFSSDSALAAG